MFNWIASDTDQYLEPDNLIDLCKIELFEIELFDPLTVYKQMTYIWLNCLLFIKIHRTI